MANPIDSLPPDVVDAWRKGRKIEAIRLLREKSGAGLAEAKAAIDALERAGGKAPGGLKVKGAIPEVISALTSLGAVPPEVADAWRRGDKTAAIQWLRQHSRTGAAIAKSQGTMVDGAKGAGAKVASPAHAPGTLAPGLAPGEMPRAKSEPWLFVVLAIALLAIWAWFKLT